MNISIDQEKIDAYLSKAAFYYDIAGIAAGIGSKGGNAEDGLLYKGAAGFRNFETKEPMQPDLIFHMASTVKLFVGTAIMQLAEQGRLDIDQKLTVCLPWFYMEDRRYECITIRQLLTHTSGMPDVTDYHWDKPETDNEALKRYLAGPEVVKARLLWDPAEAKFAYSNIGYEILGAVIAEASGMVFEDYMDRNIFRPLEMKSSTLMTFTRNMGNVCAPHYKNARNHIVVSDVFPYNRPHAPSSTLTSNVSDIGRWALANLDKTLLKEKSYVEIWRKYALIPNNGEHICLSWFAREQSGYQLFGHEGADDGFRASFWICPELGVFITVHANMTGAPVKKINKQLFEMILGNEPTI